MMPRLHETIGSTLARQPCWISCANGVTGSSMDKPTHQLHQAEQVKQEYLLLELARAARPRRPDVQMILLASPTDKPHH